MIRICDIGVVDALHVCLDIARQTRRFREAVNNRLPHLLPQQPYPVHIGRSFAGRDDQGWFVREGIVFTYGVPGSGHRLNNIVRYAVAPDVAEGAGQTAGNHCVTALQKPGKKARGIAYHQQYSTDIRRVVRKIIRRARDQGRFRREHAQAFLFHPVSSGRQCGAKIQQRCAMRKSGDFVAGSRRPHQELPGHRPVTRMQGQGLFGRETPLRPETFFQIDSAKAPERRIPGRALALHFVRAARDIPAFYDLLEKAIGQKALPVRARQVPCPDGGCAIGSLELPQDFQGLCEFFGRCGHRANPQI